MAKFTKEEFELIWDDKELTTEIGRDKFKKYEKARKSQNGYLEIMKEIEFKKIEKAVENLMILVRFFEDGPDCI